MYNKDCTYNRPMALTPAHTTNTAKGIKMVAIKTS
jgi:hypothetical protein